MKERKPLRDKFTEATEKIPSGPLGKVGGGDVVGAGGFMAIEGSKPVWQFLPGIKQPGYKTVSHSAEDKGGYERHVIVITAFSENVAKFAAQYIATPSNVDFATSQTNIVDVEEVTVRRTYSTYRITVDVDERGTLEKEGGEEYTRPRK